MTHESEGDWGETQLDQAEQAEAEINLDDPEAGDFEPWSPPDRQPRGAEFIDGDETISQRLRQEEPDPDAGYHDPDASTWSAVTTRTPCPPRRTSSVAAGSSTPAARRVPRPGRSTSTPDPPSYPSAGPMLRP